MKINLEIIKELKPCKRGLDNFLKHCPEFDGNHAEFLGLPNIPHSDKLWVILRLIKRFDVEVFAAATAAYVGAYTERVQQIESLIYLINETEG